MKKGQISLKDIAKELNLSISTVSRAIRGIGEISPETRKAVNELAQKWNYSPNPLAMGLLHNKTHTIGVLIPEITSYFFSNILRGMDKVALDAGYRILTFFSGDDLNNELEAIDKMVFYRVDGILSCPSQGSVDSRKYQQILEKNIPLVLFDRKFDGFDTINVITNNYKSTIEVVEHLVYRGRKRIALITSLEPLSVGKQRYDGYIKALEMHKIPFERDLIVHGNLGISTSIEAAKNLLALKQIPDAIICSDDSVAMAVIKTIKEYGLKIPEDIAIVGFNDESFASFLEPALTTVAQPAYLMGMKAMEKMIGLVESEFGEYVEETVVLDSALVIRSST